jgi:hypothetical protein
MTERELQDWIVGAVAVRKRNRRPEPSAVLKPSIGKSPGRKAPGGLDVG